MIPLVVAGVALFALHVVLARSSKTWAGAVVPAIWIIGTVALAAMGRFTEAQHIIAPAVGLVGLLGSWVEMRQLRVLRNAPTGA